MTLVSSYKIKLTKIIVFIILNLFANANRFGCKFNSYKHYEKYNSLTCYRINFLSKFFLKSLLKRI
ncbi:hypothetical protein EXN65_07190 [Clostridium botulinum]|uniref:Uncharacterized protein n=1 Tax=Clostridium botulinum TaxID=1491 RepID=A0A846I663_CLOBO|nr:hypothetical protein AGE29_06195 [Clostridium botulinum]NEZ86676.1 hypothetical protein [Clostridium botulinum]NEZ93850.1 hypothetical protein [Clostridium botulinum]NFB01943.1 hypothetical protein [Clostridium botulinum]NFB33372.1 hypothetical protein [Clostridium botulinum]